MRALRSYRLLVRWQALRLKGFLPLAIVVQALFAFGIVVGYPLLFPEMDETTMLFLATGAPAITLITMGLVALPQVVSQAKLEGSLEYMRSLPVPRMAYLAADLTVWMAIVLPGVVFAVLVGIWAFGLGPRREPGHHPGDAAGGSDLGRGGLRHGQPAAAHDRHAPDAGARLRRARLLAHQLPGRAVCPTGSSRCTAVLPVQAMGEVIRGSLASSTFPLTIGPFLFLGAWCVVCAGPQLPDPAAPRLTTICSARGPHRVLPPTGSSGRRRRACRRGRAARTSDRFTALMGLHRDATERAHRDLAPDAGSDVDIGVYDRGRRLGIRGADDEDGRGQAAIRVGATLDERAAALELGDAHQVLCRTAGRRSAASGVNWTSTR